MTATVAAEVWMRPLEDGSIAAGLFNRGENTVKITAGWNDLKLTGKQRVRDLWRQKDIGIFKQEFQATVAGHGVVLVRIRPLAP